MIIVAHTLHYLPRIKYYTLDAREASERTRQQVIALADIGYPAVKYSSINKII